MESFEQGNYLVIHEGREVWSTGYASNKDDLRALIQELVDDYYLDEYEIIDIEVYRGVPTDIKLVKELKVDLE